LYERFPLREHEKGLAGNQILVPLSYQFAKNPLCPIASDRIPKALPYDNPHAGGSVIHLASQQIKQCRRNPAPMPLDCFNVPAGP
jgi:hypothetical protein